MSEVSVFGGTALSQPLFSPKTLGPHMTYLIALLLGISPSAIKARKRLYPGVRKFEE
jgi:hypothetical protein